MSSRIAKSVIYGGHIANNDDKFEAPTYNVYLGDMGNTTVAFGKACHDHSSKGIVFFPMYLVVGDEVRHQIGVIEFPLTKLPSIYDEDGDIDPKCINDPVVFAHLHCELDVVVPISEPEPDEEVSVFDVKPDDKPKKPKKIGLFEKDKNHEMLPTLVSDELDAEPTYEESPKNDWITNFMKNRDYRLIADGGSLFHAICDAFSQIGENTTPQKLRDYLADEATHEQFQEYRDAFLDIKNVGETKRKVLAGYSDAGKILKQRIKGVSERSAHQTCLDEIKSLKSLSDATKADIRHLDKYCADTFGFMAGIDTFSQFQHYIKSDSYHGDNWGIATLERKVGAKFVVFSEDAYADDAHDCILACTECANASEQITPAHYILMSRSKAEYKGVVYKDRKILTFRELPHKIKLLVLNKIKERVAGDFACIPDFRNMMKKMNVEIDDSDDDGETDGDLYEPKMVLSYYAKAPPRLPGKGIGDKIAKSKQHLFAPLAKVKNWRKQLDDDYTVPFNLDGERYNTVVHYYQASKFKKRNPEFSELFVASETELSKNPRLAHTVGGRAKHKLKPASVEIDPDFYGERNIGARADALFAKFSQNLDLRDMLVLTYPAKLTLMKRGQKPEDNTPLMQVRQQLMK